MNFSHFVRTDWLYRTIIGFASLCCSTTLQSATRLEQNTARLDNEYTCGRLNRLTAHYFGYELLAIGYWLLAWLCGLADICAFTLYALRPTLYTKSDSDHASNLSPYSRITSSPLRSNFITCQRQCFDADAIGRCRSGTK